MIKLKVYVNIKNDLNGSLMQNPLKVFYSGLKWHLHWVLCIINIPRISNQQKRYLIKRSF